MRPYKKKANSKTPSKQQNPAKNPATTTTPKSTKIKYKQQTPKTYQPTPKSTKSHQEINLKPTKNHPK
jgi:hypothetical protein